MRGASQGQGLALLKVTVMSTKVSMHSIAVGLERTYPPLKKYGLYVSLLTPAGVAGKRSSQL